MDFLSFIIPTWALSVCILAMSLWLILRGTKTRLRDDIKVSPQGFREYYRPIARAEWAYFVFCVVGAMVLVVPLVALPVRNLPTAITFMAILGVGALMVLSRAIVSATRSIDHVKEGLQILPRRQLTQPITLPTEYTRPPILSFQPAPEAPDDDDQPEPSAPDNQTTT